MSSFTDLGIAASRARGAASPSTELLEPGAKRLRKRPAGGNAPLLGGAVSRDVDAAVQIGAVDVSATATPLHVVEDPVQVQRYDMASIETNSDKVDSSEDALAERLVLVVAGTSSRDRWTLAAQEAWPGLRRALDSSGRHHQVLRAAAAVELRPDRALRCGNSLEPPRPRARMIP